MKYLLSAILLAWACSPLLSEDVEMVYRDGQWVQLPPPAEGTPQGEAAIVRRDLKQQNFALAVDHANRFLSRYGTSPLREEVMFQAGNAELAQKRYWQAYQWYERQLKDFPSGNYFDQAMAKEMEVAQAFLAGAKRPALGIFMVSAQDDGLDILHRIAERGPNSDRAELALLAVAEYYVKDRRYELAAEAYDAYLRLFPKSPRAPQAEYDAADSYLRDYRGASFDDTSLIEAQQRFKAFAEHYPAAARQHDVQATLGKIQDLRAARLYQTTQFYLKLNRPTAAAEYCRILLGDYPDSAYATGAQRTLDRLENRPVSTVSPAPVPASVPPAGPSTQPYAKEKL